jgi:drug/metabolite transporter (DMT)-like permease
MLPYNKKDDRIGSAWMKKPSLTDYVLLVGIGLIWGSQFVLNELAIESIPPLSVGAGRIFFGFITLSLILGFLPKADVQKSSAYFLKQPWGMYFLIALAEAIIPLFLIPWGQQYVDSSIAAILMATIPIFTMFLANLFVKEDRWNFTTALSVGLGFIGVIILVGPDIKGNGQHHLLGELAILGAAFSFAVSMILIRKLPPVPPVLAMRNTFLMAAVPMVLLSLILNKPWEWNLTLSGLVAVVLLGIFCGGIVYLMLMLLIRRAGPTFTSLNNYLVTLFGVFIGIIFLGDRLQAHDLSALVLILLALGLSQLRGK